MKQKPLAYGGSLSRFKVCPLAMPLWLKQSHCGFRITADIHSPAVGSDATSEDSKISVPVHSRVSAVDKTRYAFGMHLPSTDWHDLFSVPHDEIVPDQSPAFSSARCISLVRVLFLSIYVCVVGSICVLTEISLLSIFQQFLIPGLLITVLPVTWCVVLWTCLGATFAAYSIGTIPYSVFRFVHAFSTCLFVLGSFRTAILAGKQYFPKSNN